MSPFVEPRARPIGNTFLDEDAENESTRIAPGDSQACGRRHHSFNHRSYFHGSLRVDFPAFYRLARQLPRRESRRPSREVLPPAARAPPLPVKALKIADSLPAFGSQALKIADSLPASVCQAKETVGFPRTTFHQASDRTNPILSTAGSPFCGGPTAQVVFMGSPVHSPHAYSPVGASGSPVHTPPAYSPVGASGFCHSIGGAALGPMLWVPDGAGAAQWPESPMSSAGRAGSKWAPCLPLESLIPPPSPASTDASTAFCGSEGSDSFRFGSEGAISTDSTVAAKDSSASPKEVPQRQSRRAARRAAARAAAAAAAVTPIGAPPPLPAVLPIGASPKVGPFLTGSGASSPIGSAPASSPASSTGRPQPRADLVRELLRTGASAMERAAALAKDLHGSSPTEAAWAGKRRH